jgi:hypothetical protein
MNLNKHKVLVLTLLSGFAGLAIFLATLHRSKSKPFEFPTQAKVRRSISGKNHSSSVKYPTVPSDTKLTETTRNNTKLNETKRDKYRRGLDDFLCILRATRLFLNATAMEKTKTTIMRSISDQTFLLKLHIAPPQHMPDTISPFLRNRILEWQYFRIEQELLFHVIPVDFGLLTFNMLEVFNEKNNINLPPFKIYDGKRTCKLRDDFSTRINIILYISRFINLTSDFMMCNLKFDDQDFKHTLYYFTTVWVGYDMLCYELNIESIENPTETKKKQYLLAPLICFFLALECIWIFKLIDLSKGHGFSTAGDQCQKQHDSCSSDEQETTPEVKHLQSRIAYKSECTCTCYYFPHDRPYSFQRLLKKIFYTKITPHKCVCDASCFQASCKQKNAISRSMLMHVINLPVFRLFSVLYIFLLLPVAIYRTVGRKVFADEEYRNYKYIVRASEPMCNSISSDEDIILLCDWTYAVFGSLIGVVLFIFHHYNISKNGYRIFSPSLGYQDVHATTVCDKLMSRIGILLDLLQYMSDQVQSLFCWTYVKSSGIPHRHKAVKSKKSQTVTVTRSKRKPNRLGVIKCISIIYFLLALVEFAFQLLLCLLPLIPFSIHHFMTALSHRKCVKIFNASVLLILTILSFRPIISSFLFLLRTLTILLFVLLPLREYIFKYFICVTSVAVYLIHYYNEVMDLLSAILIYVCELNEEKFGKNYVGQDLFNHILGKLVFFKSKIYFAVFKIIVVTSYIFITVEAVTVGNNMGVLEFFELIEYTLIFGSPYILSVLFRSGKEILNDQNKTEIQKIFNDSYKSDLVKQKSEMHHVLISSCLQGCLKSKETFLPKKSNVSDNMDINIPLQQCEM